MTITGQHGNKALREDKVSLKSRYPSNLLVNSGVYTWADRSRVRITFSDDTMNFDKRVIFAPNDFKLEYRGEVKANHVMHGTGTLTLKGSNIIYSGNWVDGRSSEHGIVLSGITQGYLKALKNAEETMQKKSEENKDRIKAEHLWFKRDEEPEAWLAGIKTLSLAN